MYKERMSLSQTHNRKSLAFIPGEFVENVWNGINDYDEAMADLEDALETAYYTISRPIVNVLDKMEFHDEVETLHDEIIALMDRVLLFHCYALKNIEFMPYAVTRNAQRMRRELDLSPEPFRDPDFHAKEIRRVIDMTFESVMDLRECFSGEMIERRKRTAWHDEFGRKILHGRELHKADMQDRMEFQFFMHHDFPLGVFEMGDRMRLHLNRALRRPNFVKHTIDEMQSGALQKIFPGFHLFVPKGQDEKDVAPTWNNAIELFIGKIQGITDNSTRVQNPKALQPGSG